MRAVVVLVDEIGINDHTGGVDSVYPRGSVLLVDEDTAERMITADVARDAKPTEEVDAIETAKVRR